MAEPDFQPGFAPSSSDSDADSEPTLEYAASLAIRKRRANRGRRMCVTAKRPRSSGYTLSGSGVAARNGHGRPEATAPTGNGVISSETEGLPPYAASHTSDAPHTTASGDTGDRASPSSGPSSASKFRDTGGTTAATSAPADAQNRSASSLDLESKQRSRVGEASVEGIWQLLMARSRAIDHAPRQMDPRFVSRNRPLDQESGLKTSIAITLFPDGYARHDPAPGRPLVRKGQVESQLAENGTGIMKQPLFEDGETSLPIRTIAELPRFPYDRSSDDLLQAIDLGLLPAEKDLPEMAHRHFYDGCLIAVVHDARKLTLPLPSSPKAPATAGTPPSGAIRQSKERVNGKLNAQPKPTVVGTVVNGERGASFCPSAPMPSSSASSLYQPGVVTSRVRLRPDGYNKLEDIEKVTERLARDEARAVEEAILRYTSVGVDCRPDAMKLKMPLSLNALHIPRPLSAPVILRSHARHTPSLSTAALMLVSTAEKQLQYARVRHMNNSVAGSRGAMNTTSTGLQSVTEHGAAGMAASAKAKAAAQASGKVGAGEVAKPLNEAAGSRALGAESEDLSNAEDASTRPRFALPPVVIREPLAPSGVGASSAKAERIRHMTLLQKGGQHAKLLQLQMAAAAGSMSSEAARQAQKSLSQGTNSGRPAYTIDVMKREKDRGFHVVISRGLPGEKRDVLRFSLRSLEESNAFVNQFRIVALAEGYFCQQDAKHVRPTGSSAQQQSSGQPRPTDSQAAIASRQNQAVLQAARYQQQIAQSQQQLNPHQLAQHQQLAQQQFAQHQFNHQQQLAVAQQRRRQEQQRQQQQSPAQQGVQRPHPTQLQTQQQQQQQQRQALQNQQKSSGSQPQAARQQQTSQQQQLLLSQQRQQQIQRQASVQQRQQQPQKVIAQHAPQHQQQFVAQLQQQSSPQQSSSLRPSGGNRQGGSVPSPSFTGIVSGGMANTVGMSPGLQSSQHLQQNHANRSVPSGQDVMAFASQYPYQQKPPTISQQQHSLYLQQQIQNLAAQNKANNLLRQSANDPAPTATFTEDDLHPSKLPHQASNRKV